MTPPSPARRPATWLILTAASLAGLALAPGTALAWGRMGHRAAAKLAEARLTPAARAAVKDLLEPGESLADASTWADEVRPDRPESAPWHYVNVPITEPRYTPRFCPEAGCVVQKVADFRRALADPATPRAARREALRFLVHFVEDLHQPVHVGHRGDRGGNDLQIRFFDQGSNLHRVWDSGLIERAFADEPALLRDLSALAGAGEAAGWGGKSVEDWADESLAAARSAYNDPSTGQPLRPGARLGEAYQATNLPVARRRLAQAGVRLADLLNEGFAAPGAP